MPKERCRAEIGTLNEGALHAQLKEWYRRPGDLLEQVTGGFVIDLVRGDLLVEIQTGGFAPLRRRLELLRPATAMCTSRPLVKASQSS